MIRLSVRKSELQPDGPPPPNLNQIAPNIVSGDGSYRAKIQKWLKWLKNDSKVTFRGQPGSDSKMTQKWLFGSFLTRKSHFWVTFVSFSSHFQTDPEKSLLGHFNSVQTRCIVKGEAQKSPLFWRFSGGFWFSQDRLLSRNSTRKPLNLIIKIPDFYYQRPL